MSLTIAEGRALIEAETEMLRIIEDSGVRVVRDVDREAFRERTAPMYEDEEFAQAEVRDMIRRIREVGTAPEPGREAS